MNSTMLDVKIDRGDPTDLYEQVAGEIRRAIADGEAKSGERLPPAKDLAAVLGVNTNTVLRALRLLRDEGLLEFRRGRGISVAGTPERGAVIARARRARRLRSRAGLSGGRARQDHRGRRLVRSRVGLHAARLKTPAGVDATPESPLTRKRLLSAARWVAAVAAVALATSPPAGTSGARGPASLFDYDRSAPLEVAWGKTTVSHNIAHQDLKFSAAKRARVAAYFVHPLAGASGRS